MREKRPGGARGAQADRARGPRPAGRAEAGVSAPSTASSGTGPPSRTGSGSTSAAPTASCARRAAPLRAGRGLGPLRAASASTATGTRRAASRGSSGRRSWRSWSRSPSGRWSSSPPAVTGFRRVWARRRTEGRLADGRLILWGHTDWVMTDVVRGTPGPRPTGVPGRVRGAARRLRARPRAAAAHPGRRRPPRDARPAAGPGPHGPRQQRRVPRLPRGGAGGAGDGARPAISGTPRRIRLEYLAPAAPGAGLVGVTWPETFDGAAAWAWRLADDDGRELARARVLPRPPDSGTPSHGADPRGTCGP